MIFDKLETNLAPTVTIRQILRRVLLTYGLQDDKNTVERKATFAHIESITKFPEHKSLGEKRKQQYLQAMRQFTE